MLTPKLEEVVPEHEAFVGVIAETARLGVEDALDRAANLGIDLQDLVGLFLILGEVDLRRAVADQVLDLGGRVGRVQPDRDASYGDRGEIEDDPLGVVLGVDGDPVPTSRPVASRPWAAVSIRSQVCAQLYSCQMPKSFSRIATLPGMVSAQSVRVMRRSSFPSSSRTSPRSLRPFVLPPVDVGGAQSR